MKHVRKAFLIAASTTLGVWAQTEETRSIPLPIVNPRAVPAGVNPEPLTPAEKAKLAMRNTIGTRAIGNRILVAGLDQWRDNPEEWGGGMDAYGQRFASRMGRLAVSNSIRLSTDIALGIDPRYDRCLCSGFLSRTGHAWKRVVVARSDYGTEMPAYSNFAAAYGTPAIAYAWYPDRFDTPGKRLQTGTLDLGWRGVTNMLREFWPDIKRGLRRGGSQE